MPTIQYRASRIWEMKEDKFTKRLAKNQVCAVFQMRDLPKFIKLCMKRHVGVPVGGGGGRGAPHKKGVGMLGGNFELNP